MSPLILIGSLVLLLALPACSTVQVSGGQPGPSGRPIYMVVSRTPADLFKQANKTCTHGYDFVAPPQVTSDSRQAATVECR